MEPIPGPSSTATTPPAVHNLEAFQQLFPGVVQDGVLDAARLGEALGIDVAGIKGGKERFGLMWAGKQKAVEALQAPSYAALVPDLDNSVNWDTAENVFIEGDNLEVLKLLQNAYNDQVKLIYIDPPYNTGNDFVYNDDFSDPLKHYLEVTGQVDAEGNRLVANTEVSGRKHSNWLTMMYPRLVLARNLLTQDGVICISIDDNEVSNLRALLNEVFGEENFVGQITRITNLGGSEPKFIRKVHDYVIVYARNIDEVEFGGLAQSDKVLALSDERGSYAKGRELNKWGAGSRRVDAPTMWFPIPAPDGSQVYPMRNDGSEGRWRFGKSNLLAMLEADNVHWEKRTDGSWLPYEKLRNSSRKPKAFNTLWEKSYTNAAGSERLKALLGTPRAAFDYAKPVQLVADLCTMAGVGPNDLVLDFFAGSATTADAVMTLNAADAGHRKFICVNIAENTEEKSIARELGYEVVSEVSRLRIKAAERDLGSEPNTRYFSLGASSLRINNAVTEELWSETSLKANWTSNNLVTEIALALGVALDQPLVQVNPDSQIWMLAPILFVLGDELELVETISIASHLGAQVLVALEDNLAGKDDLKANLFYACKKANITFKTF